jgi:hypothetical protein
MRKKGNGKKVMRIMQEEKVEKEKKEEGNE